MKKLLVFLFLLIPSICFADIDTIQGQTVAGAAGGLPAPDWAICWEYPDCGGTTVGADDELCDTNNCPDAMSSQSYADEMSVSSGVWIKALDNQTAHYLYGPAGISMATWTEVTVQFKYKRSTLTTGAGGWQRQDVLNAIIGKQFAWGSNAGGEWDGFMWESTGDVGSCNLNGMPMTTTPVADTWYVVTLYWKAATCDGCNDGIQKVYIDSTLNGSKTNCDNDTKTFAGANVRLGGYYSQWTTQAGGTESYDYWKFWNSNQLSNLGLE